MALLKLFFFVGILQRGNTLLDNTLAHPSCEGVTAIKNLFVLSKHATDSQLVLWSNFLLLGTPGSQHLVSSGLKTTGSYILPPY